MLQPPDSQKSQLPSNFSPSKSVSVPVEQATIGRSVVIKGENEQIGIAFSSDIIQKRCLTICNQGTQFIDFQRREFAPFNL